VDQTRCQDYAKGKRLTNNPLAEDPGWNCDMLQQSQCALHPERPNTVFRPDGRDNNRLIARARTILRRALTTDQCLGKFGPSRDMTSKKASITVSAVNISMGAFFWLVIYTTKQQGSSGHSIRYVWCLHTSTLDGAKLRLVRIEK
jgi:hypothetical protein